MRGIGRPEVLQNPAWIRSIICPFCYWAVFEKHPLSYLPPWIFFHLQMALPSPPTQLLAGTSVILQDALKLSFERSILLATKNRTRLKDLTSVVSADEALIESRLSRLRSSDNCDSSHFSVSCHHPSLLLHPTSKYNLVVK